MVIFFLFKKRSVLKSRSSSFFTFFPPPLYTEVHKDLLGPLVTWEIHLKGERVAKVGKRKLRGAQRHVALGELDAYQYYVELL